MELRDLKTLVRVVRTGSFTRAAAELGYTQSAVSQQIATLEAELNETLLARRPVRVTAAGLRLTEHAEHILLRLDVARSEIEHFRNRQSSLRLATTPLADRAAVSATVSELRAGDLTRQVALRSLSPAEAIAAVASGEVDAAFVDGVAAPDEPLHLAEPGLVASRFLAQKPIVVAMPADHPLARRSSVASEMLVDAPWVATPGLIGPAALARLGIPSPRQIAAYEGYDVHALLALVRASFGCAALPADHTEAPDGLRLIPLQSVGLLHRSELLTLKGRLSLVSEFGGGGI